MYCKNDKRDEYVRKSLFEEGGEKLSFCGKLKIGVKEVVLLKIDRKV